MFNRLKKRRRAMGYTQHRLATLAKIPLGRLVYFETGRSKLTGAELARIEQVFAARAKEIARMVQTDDLGRAGRSGGVRLRSEALDAQR